MRTSTALLGSAILAVALAACGGANGPPGPHEAGLSCNADTDCMKGLFCATEDPGGQCIRVCSPRMDATCYDIRYACSFQGHCYFRCNTNADCARANEGYVCKDDTPPRGIKYCDTP
jgi:hypothetical protein